MSSEAVSTLSPPLPALPTPDEFRAQPRKAVALFGMSGVGKTYLANRLRASGSWFHYSVDYRIGTRYMGENIVDNFKREAMKSPFLRELLLSDSIYIASNLAFENLKPLSTYLGKPGDPAKGGLPFDEYVRRQRQHRGAEIAAMADASLFIEKAQEIYGYEHFLCDASGSLVEVADPDDPADPVLTAARARMLPVFLRGDAADRAELMRRFDEDPKPMYYDEAFLRASWADYLAETRASAEHVDPNAFIRWGFQRLISRRAPRYQAIADRWGVTVERRDAAQVETDAEFIDLIADALPRR